MSTLCQTSFDLAICRSPTQISVYVLSLYVVAMKNVRGSAAKQGKVANDTPEFRYDQCISRVITGSIGVDLATSTAVAEEVITVN